MVDVAQGPIRWAPRIVINGVIAPIPYLANGLTGLELSGISIFL